MRHLGCCKELQTFYSVSLAKISVRHLSAAALRGTCLVRRGLELLGVARPGLDCVKGSLGWEVGCEVGVGEYEGVATGGVGFKGGLGTVTSGEIKGEGLAGGLTLEDVLQWSSRGII